MVMLAVCWVQGDACSVLYAWWCLQCAVCRVMLMLCCMQGDGCSMPCSGWWDSCSVLFVWWCLRCDVCRVMLAVCCVEGDACSVLCAGWCLQCAVYRVMIAVCSTESAGGLEASGMGWPWNYTLHSLQYIHFQLELVWNESITLCLIKNLDYIIGMY